MFSEMKACSEDPPNSMRNCRVQHELTLKYLHILRNPEKDHAWTRFHSTEGMLGYRIHKGILTGIHRFL